jgi:hypothetical protein
LTDELIARVAKELLGALVYENDPAVTCGRHHSIGQTLEDGPQRQQHIIDRGVTSGPPTASVSLVVHGRQSPQTSVQLGHGDALEKPAK